MKLTKEQRNKSYKLMLEEIKEDDGFCLLSKRLFGFYPRSDGFVLEVGKEEYFTDVFPELYNLKPTITGYTHWFTLTEEGLEQRKKLLIQCIKETNPEK